MSDVQQLLFPWGQYKVSQVARVLGVSRGKALTAIRRLGIIGNGVRGRGVPADQVDALRDTLGAIAEEATARSARAAEKREAKASRKATAA